ncbi:MAG: 3'-5' exonuclease [Candidatus Woesearchaeota archaeon]
MIIVDVETTGLDPDKHSIVSIGAIDLFIPQKQFYDECRIWDDAEITQQALDINGFSKEEITSPIKKPLEDIVTSFLNWSIGIGNRTLAGENPSFDRDFLISSLKRYNHKWPLGHRTIDLHTACYIHHLRKGKPIPIKNNKTNINTNSILNYVGLPDEPDPHNALTGAKMEAEAFSRLIYGKGLLEEFDKYKLPDHLKT